MDKLFTHLTANYIKLNEMPFSGELAMEGYLADNPEIFAFDDDHMDVDINEIEKHLPGGRKSGSGRIDLLAFYSDAREVAVIELKKGILKSEHLKQLEDYLSKKNRETICDALIEKQIINKEEAKSIPFIGFLVGSGIDPKLDKDIDIGIKSDDNKNIPVGYIVLKRHKSDDGQVFVMSDVHFNPLKSSKDKTKYIFGKEVFSKNGLVLAVVKKYVTDQYASNKEVTFANLAVVFPKHLQGSTGVFNTRKHANDVFAKSGYKRYFMESEDFIKLTDEEIAVCNQWGTDNIPRFIEHVKGKLKYIITPAKE